MKFKKLFPYAISIVSISPVFVVLSCSHNASSNNSDSSNENFEINISNSLPSYEINVEYSLEANIFPFDSEISYSWKSSDPSLRIVNNTDKKKQVSFIVDKADEYKLTVEASKEGKVVASKAINILVEDVSTSSVNVSILSNENFKFEQNQSYSLEARVDPQTSNISYEWTLPNQYFTSISSLDKSVIQFEAIATGTCQITCSVYDNNHKLIGQKTEQVIISKSDDAEPTHSITLSGDINKTLYILNNYSIIANIQPSYANAYFEWSSPSANDLNLRINENQVSFKPKTSGNFSVSLIVWSDAQKSKQLAQKDIEINVNDYDVFVNVEASYDINKSYKLSADVQPSGSYNYSWTCSDQNLKLTNQNTQTLTFESSVPNSYQVNLLVTNNQGDIIKEYNNIPINIVSTITPYEINFNNVTDFIFGNSSVKASDSSVNESWIKQKIIDNKNQIFSIPTSIPTDFNWNSNIVISQINPNDQDQSISFTLTLNNADEIGKEISKTISFLGFKDPNNNSNDYVINFSSQDTFEYGDPSINLGAIKAANLIPIIQQKIFDNKEQIFNIQGNADSYLWKDRNYLNLEFPSKGTSSKPTDFDAKGILQITLTLNKYDSSNLSAPSKLKTITFTGFENKQAYDIQFESTQTNFEYGDPSRYANDSSFDVNWAKQIILNNKERFFSWRSQWVDNNFDWNQNLIISNFYPDKVNRIISFRLTLNNSNQNGNKLVKDIYFTNFKEPQWNTTSMPSSSELLIDNIQFTNSFDHDTEVQESNAGTKLNEYGVVRTFALMNTIIKDTLFVDLGFSNVSIIMKNNNFNDLTFVITGTSMRDINNFGKGMIPCSGMIENWQGATIHSGDKVELTMNYSRSNSNALGTDKFDLTQNIQWKGNIVGFKDIVWKSKNIKFMYLNEFYTQATLKINNNISKQSPKDNRTFFVFVQHNNGKNIFVDWNSIVSTTRKRNFLDTL